MRMAVVLSAVLFCLLHPLAGAAAGPVTENATEAQVLEALGKPQSRISAGDRSIWTYPQGRIEFSKGLVTRVAWKESVRPPGQTSATTEPGPSGERPFEADVAIDDTRGDDPLLADHLARLVVQLTDNSRRVRCTAASKLKHHADPSTWDTLVRNLDHQDLFVRYTLLDALHCIDSQRAAEHIVSIARNHPDAEFRAKAIARMRNIPEAEAIAHLIQCMTDDDAVCRRTAARELCHFNEPALKQLSVALRDPSPGTRRGAVMALGSFGKVAEDELVLALGDKDSEVKIEAMEALRKMTGGAGERSEAAVKELLSDEDAAVRDAASTAIAGIQSVRETMSAQSRKKSRDLKRTLLFESVFVLLAVGLAFRFRTLGKPPAPAPPPRFLCLVAGLSSGMAVMFLFACNLRINAGFTLDSLLEPEALLFVFLVGSLLFGLSYVAASRAMSSLRASWAHADAVLAATSPRNSYSHLVVDGFIYLGLTIAVACIGFYHLQNEEMILVMMSAAIVVTFAMLAGVNLFLRNHVSPAMQRLPQEEPVTFDIPARPLGIKLVSALAIGLGLVGLSYAYWAITYDLTSPSSAGAGFGILLGMIASAPGIAFLLGGRRLYLLRESGKQVLMVCFALCCLTPALPLALVALLYLNTSSAKECLS